MNKFVFAALLLVSFASCSVAKAASFNFTFSGSGLNASGTLTTTNTPVGGFYTVTGLSGTQNGFAMSLLNAGAFASNDNLFSPNSPYFDFSGLSYVASGVDYNLFNNGVGSIRVCTSCIGYSTDGRAVTFSATPAAATPEPGSLFLLGSGLLGGIPVIRRRFTA